MSETRKLQNLVTAAGLTLGVAESCTGGGLAGRITDVPGSSEYFLGGVVAYHNSVKENLLKVPASTLAAEGAVSEETALHMASGALNCLRADLALATTGIAGPTGGTNQKPVGLVYIALASSRGLQECLRRNWEGSRKEIRDQTIREAISLAICYLQKDSTP